MQWKWPANWKRGWEKNKWLLIAVFAGILLLLPAGAGERKSQQEVAQKNQPEMFDLSKLERRMEDTLSKIDGAGNVALVLTLKEDGRQVYAQDVRTDQREQSRTAVIINRGGGVEEIVPVQRFSPTFQGALAVCPGGANPEVKLQLTQAIHALTGLSTEKISICQSKK